MKQQSLENYFRTQQVSLQWLPFLRALADEFSATASAEEIGDFFFRIGEQYAKASAACFNDVDSLEQLEQSLNRFWPHINWGWIDLRELPGYVEIVHYASPLAEAFGDDRLSWSCCLLEGFYETVFSVLGAGDHMRVRTHDATDGMAIVLRFGQQ